jgi:hypothetical protein
MSGPAKVAVALVGIAFVVGLVYELWFNESDAFVGLVVIALVAYAATLLALIWVVDDIIVRIAKRRRLGKSAR